MSAMIIWMLGIGASIAAMIVAAALKLQYVHMAIAAIVCIFMALAAIAEVRATPEGADRPHLRASTTMRYLGMVWTWGALALITTYSFVLKWSDWVPFFVLCLMAGGLFLFVSATLRKDGEAGAGDEKIVRVGRGLAMVQLIATGVALVALLAKGSFNPSSELGYQFWAANNLFLFGALALGAISWNALLMESKSAH